MKTFAAVMTIAASALCSAMDVDAAESTTKSLKNLSAEQCDAKVDKNCAQPPMAKATDAASGNSPSKSKPVQQSEVETKALASKGGVERSVAGPPTNRSVSGTIGPRPANAESKGANAQRTGDPLPDVDVSLDRKTGGVARVKAP
ncbi:MAG: hypothetical protein ABI724_06705 [Betaproteobacteria bacterium]